MSGDSFAPASEGQTAEKQSTDEATCYDWAVQNTGTDPFALEQQSQQAQQATAEQVDNFKKAFSVCLEANKYMVKF